MATIIFNSIPQKKLISRISPRPQDTDDPRGVYFRDATAILHCTAFRRLRHKTQVFFAPSNDHICTRLEHVLHVSSIAVTICRALNLDTDLAWAIGLGHDLGHTPFGHLGEQVLSNLTGTPFSHELHSLRVVDIFADLNLTYAVRDGIVTHCGEKFEQYINPAKKIQNITSFTDRNAYPSTYEGCVVRMADKIAYLGRDYEDAVRLKIIDGKSLCLPSFFTSGIINNAEIINIFVKDLITYSQKTGTIGFSKSVHTMMNTFKKFNNKHIYQNKTLTLQGNKVGKLLTILYKHLYTCIITHKTKLLNFKPANYEVEKLFKDHIDKWNTLYCKLQPEAVVPQLLTDFIARMSDDYVITSVKELLFLD